MRRKQLDEENKGLDRVTQHFAWERYNYRGQLLCRTHDHLWLLSPEKSPLRKEADARQGRLARQMMEAKTKRFVGTLDLAYFFTATSLRCSGCGGVENGGLGCALCERVLLDKCIVCKATPEDCDCNDEFTLSQRRFRYVEVLGVLVDRVAMRFLFDVQSPVVEVGTVRVTFQEKDRNPSKERCLFLRVDDKLVIVRPRHESWRVPGTPVWAPRGSLFRDSLAGLGPFELPRPMARPTPVKTRPEPQEDCPVALPQAPVALVPAPIVHPSESFEQLPLAFAS
jgi:hypothetical protein